MLHMPTLLCSSSDIIISQTHLQLLVLSGINHECNQTALCADHFSQLALEFHVEQRIPKVKMHGLSKLSPCWGLPVGNMSFQVLMATFSKNVVAI